MVTLKVRGLAQKRCPYKDEVDVGVAELTFEVPYGDGPELHELAQDLESYAELKLSHEEFTRALFGIYALVGCVRVRTAWRTAGLAVVCEVPDRRD